MTQYKLAQRIISLLDVTALQPTVSEMAIDALCQQAMGPHGQIAAVSVWPRFVPQCRQLLEKTSVAVSTVVNFPAGRANIKNVIAETRAAVAYGADEISLVFPYQAWLDGHREVAIELVKAAKDACQSPWRDQQALLKVILETVNLRSLDNIIEASQDMIAAGADFLESTTDNNDTLVAIEAIEAILGVVKTSAVNLGVKITGAIDNLAAAEKYLALAENVMGTNWPTRQRFRFGSNQLLANIQQLFNAQQHRDQQV
jgi:deoxyribose-phosphate aldolase